MLMLQLLFRSPDLPRRSQAARSPLLVLSLLAVGFLSLSTVSNSAAAAPPRLLPGEAVTLKAATKTLVTAPIQVLVPTTGEYIIETHGDTDTHCQIIDRNRGPFASDNNSGKARNCRLSVRLQSGAYRLHIRKGKRPVRVTMQAYKAQGTLEDIAEGALVQDTLKAAMYRTFQLTIKRRRWLTIKAKGLTLDHCRLFTAKRWPVALKWIRHYRPSTRRRRRRRSRTGTPATCSISGLIEPGKYLFRTYGRANVALSKSQANLEVQYGARELQPMRWQHVQLSRKQRRQHLWFQLPKAKSQEQTTRTLVIEIQHKMSYHSWRMYLYRQAWTEAVGKAVGTCWNSRYRTTCTLIRKARAGQRFVMQFYSYYRRALKVRYYAFTHAETAKLGRPAQQLALAGQISQIKFNIAKAGKYWVQVKPAAKSCYIARTDRPLHKRLHTTRGVTVPNGDSKLLRLSLTKRGRTLWFKVLRKGMVTWETQGNTDTYCTLSTWRGTQLGYNDDGGDQRNCRISRMLQPGVYRIFARVYRGRSRDDIPLKVTHKGGSKKGTKADAEIEPGCAFVANLQPGPYKLVAEESETTAPRFTYIVAKAQKRRFRLPRQGRVPPMDVLSPLKPLQVSGAHWRKWFPLARHQTRTLAWRVVRGGFYRLHSLGHLQLQCRFVARDGVVTRHTGNTNDGNCHMTSYLKPGTYHIRIQAQGQTAGTAGVKVKRLVPKVFSLKTLHQVGFGAIKPHQVGAVSLPRLNNPHSLVRALSLDAPIRCRLLDEEGWPLSAKGCHLKPGKSDQKQTLFLHATLPDKITRVSFLASTKQGTARLRPRLTRRLGYRSDPQKDIPLLLNQDTNGQLSVLGWDAYTFALSQPTTLQISLTNHMRGRLFRAGAFVGEITNKTSTTAQASMTLKAGQYRLLVRHKQGLINQRYTLATKIQMTAPGARFWIPTPTSLKLKLDEAAQVDIRTAGDVDTWCSLDDSKGALLERNDDQNASRWDCAISRYLQAGTYRIHVGGDKGGTWLHVKKRLALRLTLTPGQSKKAKPLPAGMVYEHAFTNPSDTPTLATFNAKGEISSVRCVLAHKGRILRQLEGRRCQLTYACGKGTYSWRITTKDNTFNTYRYGLRTQAVATVSPGGTTTLSLTHSKQGYVALKIANAGPYKLQLKGPGPYRCRRLNVGPSQPFACDAPMSLSPGLHLLKMSAPPTANSVALSLQSEPLAAGQQRKLRVNAAELLTMPVQIKQTGAYLVTVKSDDNGEGAWGCQLGSAQGTTRRGSGAETRCALVAHLTAGQHGLRIWRPKAQGGTPPTMASLHLHHLKAPKPEALPSRVHLFERQLAANHGHSWSLPRRTPLSGQLVLHGHGVAFVSQAENILATCVVHGTTQCRWYSPGGKAPVSLSAFALQRKLVLRASFQETPSRLVHQTLQPGQLASLTQTSQAATHVLWLRAAHNTQQAIVEVHGQAHCTVYHQGPRFATGCRQTVSLGTTPIRLEVRSKGGYVSVYTKGQRTAALWGSARPKETTPPQKAIEVGSTRHALNGGEVTWYKLNAPGGPIVLTAQGHHLSCALFDAKGTILTAAVGHTCTVTRPTSAGTYWLGLRQLDGKALQGSLTFKMSLMLSLTQGRHGPYLLGAGESRWFRFQVKPTQPKHKGQIGVGIIDQRDALICRLFDARHKLIATGCQQHTQRNAGQYKLQVSLPAGHRATTVRVVLRGLNPPAAKPPRAFLKKIKREQSN